ncbi:uncharacterized protein LOC126293502 isoform X2 [Schistocerca gregaria]|uniref:uncharacterized protein LOC126293502 isoform X2 n=1 Tax=Schistocerca gregaria TaxID=7010 RepID=UPI00211EB315|nr:uncharacterized protein LOC126293502 isoform X2 [Schistocerca gregaria]
MAAVTVAPLSFGFRRRPVFSLRRPLTTAELISQTYSLRTTIDEIIRSNRPTFSYAKYRALETVYVGEIHKITTSPRTLKVPEVWRQTHNSNMASESECRGGCLVTAEEIAEYRSCEMLEAPASTVTSVSRDDSDTIPQSYVSATNLNTQQSETAVSYKAERVAHGTGAWHLSIDDLPDVILIKIFSHLSFRELVDVVQKVCCRWKMLSQEAELWTDMEFRIKYSSDYDDMWKGVKTDGEAIRTFCDLPNLRNVRVFRPAKSRVFRALYNRCRRLSTLRLHAAQKLSYSVLENLVEKCSRIRTLRISNELLKSEKFSDTVSRLQDLRVLEVAMNLKEPIPVLWPLGDGCPRLAEVDFVYTTFDMDDLKYFLNAKRNTLKRIRINSEAVIGKRTGGLPKLRLLNLRAGRSLDDSTVIAISHGFPTLRELCVRHSELLSDTAFSQICHLEHLEILDVSGCTGLGGTFVPYLVRLPQLHTLVMEELEFPKLLPGLSSILELSGLRALSLSWSLVSGVPFDRFPGNLVSLRELTVHWCRGDPKATDGLTEQMPKLKIHGYFEDEEPDSDSDDSSRSNSSSHRESDNDESNISVLFQEDV